MRYLAWLLAFALAGLGLVPHALRADASPAAGSAASPDQLGATLDDARIDWSATPVMQRLGRMAATLQDTEYTHGFHVDERAGRYRFDCSGMVHWVLRRAAPRAAAASAHGLQGRPLARDYVRHIARIPDGRTRNGWQRVGRVADVRPGDVVAWIKPAIIDSPNTGHVAFVVLPPEPVPGRPNAYLLRISDSTSLPHDADTRQGRSGFGFGTILLYADPETGKPLGYGWVGLRFRTFETQISIGRPVA